MTRVDGRLAAEAIPRLGPYLVPKRGLTGYCPEGARGCGKAPRKGAP